MKTLSGIKQEPLASPYIESKASKINNTLKQMGANFYITCSKLRDKGNKAFHKLAWRRKSDFVCDTDFPNISYVSEKTVRDRLKKQFGVTLELVEKSPSEAISKAKRHTEASAKPKISAKEAKSAKLAEIKAKKEAKKKEIQDRIAAKKQAKIDAKKPAPKVEPKPEPKNDVKKEFKPIKEFDSKSREMLRYNGKIVGWIEKTNNDGWAYHIGKPSDRATAKFTGNTPLTKEEAMKRLKEATEVKFDKVDKQIEPPIENTKATMSQEDKDELEALMKLLD